MGKRRSRDLPFYTLRHEGEAGWLITCRRAHSVRTVAVSQDEALWGREDWQRLSRLFWWHQGRRSVPGEPHPMGILPPPLPAASHPVPTPGPA